MKNGGSAFPGSYKDGNARGMTLRDYFAGQALAGICAARGEGTHEFLAEWAYGIAEAMLAEREKE